VFRGLSAHRCPMPSAPPFSTCRDPAPSYWVCGYLLRTIPWCRPTVLSTVFLPSSVPQTFQTSPPSPAYCPSSCLICPNRFSFLSTICCSLFFLHRTLLRTSSFNDAYCMQNCNYTVWVLYGTNQSINQSINQYRLMRLKIDLRSLLTQPQPGPHSGKANS